MKYLLLLVLVALSGCTSGASIIKALAKDPAASSVEVVAAGVTVKYTRAGQTTNSLTITPSSADVNKK